jgi:predicted Zn-dependent peptidase
LNSDNNRSPLVSALALTAAFFLACVFSYPALAETLQERVKEYRLDNGLRILALHRDGSPTFSVFTRFLAGAVDENVGETGVAHILEHMLFKGSKRVGTTDFKKEKPLMEKVEKLGEELDAERRKGDSADKEKVARLRKEMAKVLEEQRRYIVSDEISSIYSGNGGAAFNAFTNMDITSYIVKLPSNRLELWAWVESDRLRSPVLREYYAERDVVMEERRRSVDNSPQGTLYEQFKAAAFQAHPYGNPIIGWESDISFLPKRKVKKFLKTYYSPNNMVVCIVGDIEPDEVFRVIKKYFGDIPAQDIPPRIVTKEPSQKGERRINVQFDAQPEVLIGFHKPVFPDRDDYVFDVIDSILSGGRTSRLYKSLVLEKGIAVSVDSWAAPGSRYDNLFAVGAVPREPHTTAELEAAVYEELARLQTEPVPARELQKVINNVDADYIRSLKSNSGLAYYLSVYEIITNDWRNMIRYQDEIKKVTPEDIMRVAKKYLVKRNRTVATLVKPSEDGNSP